MATKDSKLSYTKYKKLYLSIILGAMIVLLAAWLMGIWLKKPNAQHNVEQTLNEINLDSIQLAGQANYDEGCTTTDTGWFGKTTLCYFGGYKLYKSNGENLLDNIKRFDTLLREQGWQAEATLPGASALQDAKRNGQGPAIAYRNITKASTVTIKMQYFSDSIKPAGARAAQFEALMNFRKHAQLADDEYLVGVTVETGY